MAKFYQNAGEPNNKMNWVSEKDNPDTTNDSWDSGAFQKDLPDHYQNYEENDPSDDDHLEDEGDENDLGDMSDEEFRLRNRTTDSDTDPHLFDPIDDCEWNDASFDCD